MIDPELIALRNLADALKGVALIHQPRCSFYKPGSAYRAGCTCDLKVLCQRWAELQVVQQAQAIPYVVGDMVELKTGKHLIVKVRLVRAASVEVEAIGPDGQQIGWGFDVAPSEIVGKIKAQVPDEPRVEELWPE